MSSPHSTIYMIGSDRSRLGRLAQLIQREGNEAVLIPNSADFFIASRMRRPDCIFLDMTPDAGTDGEEADPFLILRELVQSDSMTPVVCLSSDHSLRRAVRAMRLGAFDYLPISCTSLEFRTALDEALEFQLKNRQQATQRCTILSRYKQLTAREKQVFALTVSGLPNKEIAETLDLAHQTVKIHRGRVLAKMAASSTLDLFRFAQVLGHIPASSGVQNLEQNSQDDQL